MVITGLTRNQFVRKHTRVRIPLSPPRKTSVELVQLRFFFIDCDSNGISSRFSVYIIAAGAYHQPQVVYFRNDDIQNSVLMIYRNKLRMIYKANALILDSACRIKSVDVPTDKFIGKVIANIHRLLL